MDRRVARAYATGVQAYLRGRPFVDCLRTTLAAGVTHLSSWCKSADLMTAAHRCVVTQSNVSIDAYGLVGVSVEPVVTSVLALP